jgi:hypothetical protein
MPAKDAIAEIKTTAAGIIDALTSLKSGLLVAYGNQEKAQGQ